MNKKGKGLSLLELMLVLVIIAVVLIMATRYFQQASESSQVSETTTKIKKIINASYEWSKGNNTFDGLTAQSLIDLGLLTENDIKGPWGETIEVAGGSASKSTDDQIQISLFNVPKTSCITLRDILIRQNIDTSTFYCTTDIISVLNMLYPRKAHRSSL
jgi:prepilin-type N-terminal cleavage/methylation domain-containing protein